MEKVSVLHAYPLKSIYATSLYLLRYILMKLAKCLALYDLLCVQVSMKRDTIYFNVSNEWHKLIEDNSEL